MAVQMIISHDDDDDDDDDDELFFRNIDRRKVLGPL